ncbi:HNH endonuclease [Lysinibacillus fusiformis]|uniref:HNH endonuclease n=1 Tax=Lysinibacillus fusiformis TaxID=28031 RepID=UPI003CF80F02
MNVDFENFKLKMDIKPGAYHGNTVRTNISQSLWKKIRSSVLEKNNYACTICGYQPPVEELKKLHVHEVEEYGEDELLCILKDLDLICINCHSMKHIGRTFSRLNNEQLNKLKLHFISVNNCSEDDYKEYLREFKFRKREAALEAIEDEVKMLEKNTVLDNLVLYRIEGNIPFKEEVIKQLANRGLYQFNDDDDELMI